MSMVTHRHRAVAPALIGFALGACLVAAAPAWAQPEASGRQVTFSGDGLLGVSCAANPSASSVTIEAESSLKVVNRTGYRATLLLDGAPRGEVAKGSTAEVLFHRGPVSLSLKPHCVLAQQKTTRVQVIARRPTPQRPYRNPAPRPGAAGAVSSPATPAGHGASTDQAGLGQAQPSGDERPAGRPDAGGAGSAAAGNGGAGQSGGGQSAANPPGSASTDQTGSAADVTLGDDSIAGAGTDDLLADVPGVDGGDGGPMDAAQATAEVSDVGGNLAAEPLASVEPITDKGPTGLLALIAMICVFGSSAGAIRAILAQRATRAGLAVN